MQTNKIYKEGFITRLVEKFLTSRLSIVLILLSVALGLAALWGMPKEEDPQIVVPMADVFVSAPGASAEEVHSQVSTPLERLLLQTKGVEDVYSVSKNGQAIVTAKFYVGTNQEDALVRLNNQIQMHQDEVPAIVKKWIVKPVSIDDVPIVNITFYSSFYNAFQLRQIAQEVLTQLSDMPEISKTYLLGGNLFQARIILDPIKLSGMGLGIPEILQAIQRSNMAGQVGSVIQNDHSSTIEIQSFLKNTDSLKNLVVAVHQGRPIYLYQVAEVLNGSSDDETYANIGFQGLNQPMAAVTIGLAKKSGTNAVLVSNQILSRLNQLKTTVIPNGVSYQITRNYGETAHEKVNELLFSLGLAISTVIIVLILFLGWREALIVAVSVPISFALALFLDYLLGYSINRVTLFALILSLGLVVDDPITNVENIQRHIRLKQASFFDSILIAVNEVLPPVIMASLTIIVSFLPLFFITGMMGPYMSPMAATVPLTIIFSTIASLTVVPWMAYKLLASRESGSGALTIQNNSAQHDLTQHDSVTPEWIRRNYRRIVEPFLESRKKRYGLLLSMLGALVLCGGLVFFNQVPLQLLPFDNNNVLQLVINLPEGATLEDSARTVSDFESYLKTSSYIQSFTAYIGTPAPMDFNGMVRHYYLRSAPNLATIDIQLIPKGERWISSHAIGLSMRKNLEAIAAHSKAKLSIVEMPPGPPVMQTIVAEVTGTPSMSYEQIIAGAQHVESLLKTIPLVVDVSDSSETPRNQYTFLVNQEKAALNGISSETILNTVHLALGSLTDMSIHVERNDQPVQIKFEIPKSERQSSTDLLNITVKGDQGQSVSLRELGAFINTPAEQPIYQKNLERTVFIYANTAGSAPTDSILSIVHELNKNPPPPGIKVNWSGEGSLHITLNVFRDMGIGFAAALIAIYILLFIQTDSFFIPIIMMLAIPLTIIGIVPGFALLNLIANHPIDGFPNPIFFTATSMIGMIALGGIVIRNSVILVSFIDRAKASGMDFKEAVLESGAVRFRPIFLTALTAALGAWPIAMDPIFSGLAWALIFGLLASTTFTLLVIPVTYYAFYSDDKTFKSSPNSF